MAATAMTGQGLEMMATRSMRTPAQSLAARNSGLFEAQRKARRGPTPEVFFAKHIDNTRIVKADDPVRRKEMRHFSAAMAVLFCMVMVYVWQHFSAIEVGYHVETQKAAMEQMRETNRQLRLSEAQMTDPGRIDAMAKQLGLAQPLPGQVVRPDGAVEMNGPVLAQLR